MDKHGVINELIFFSAQGGELFRRTERHPLPLLFTPDRHVRRMLGWETDPSESALMHSTSWRYDPGLHTVILTWAIIPDPRPEGATPLTVRDPAMGADGLHPVPEDLTADDVIAHAARHLSFLLHTDPIVEEALHNYRELHDALIAFAPDVAGNPHMNPIKIEVEDPGVVPVALDLSMFEN